MNLLPLIKITRPRQWLKNLMVFFPPLLSGSLFHAGVFSKGLVPFIAFCFASSSAYIFNDILDIKKDSLHPVKKSRPIAAGVVSIATAKIQFLILLATAVILGWSVSSIFFLYVAIYLFVSFVYTGYLKQVPIVDVFCISLGFILRLYGGGEAFGVYLSDWLFLSVFLLALFLSLGKRFGEQSLLGSEAVNHRQSLDSYPEGFLESSMYLTGGAVVVTYAIYAITRPHLVYTVPLCMFGLLRYLLRVKVGHDGDPTDALLKDFPLLVTGVLWMLLVSWSAYQ